MSYLLAGSLSLYLSQNDRVVSYDAQVIFVTQAGMPLWYVGLPVCALLCGFETRRGRYALVNTATHVRA